MNPIAKNVLDFWFGNRPVSLDDHQSRMKIWFSSDADFDYDIERRFGKLVSTARRGAFDSWSEDPENCLALILILDQFPRNLYRGQAGAFSSDKVALTLTQGLISSGAIDHMGCSEQGFALMPYQHSEDFDVQEEGLQAYKRLAEKAPAEWRSLMDGYASFAKQHLDIIQRFGRFPHRNAALGRVSTDEETDYLNDNGQRFGQ